MNDVRWEGFTHQEIYDRVQRGPGATASAGATAAWRTVEDTLRAVDAQLSQAVRGIGVGWEGVAADGARGGMQGMSRWAVDAADNALLTWNGVADQARGADVVRHAMPPPRPQLDVAVALGAAGGYGPRTTSVGAIEDGMAEDRARAVDLMNRYTGASSSNRLLMDHWTAPPTVVVETAPRGGTAAGGAHGGGRGPGAGGAVLVPASAGARATAPAAAASRGVPPGSVVGPAAAGGAARPGPGGGVAPAGRSGDPGRSGPSGAGTGADPTAVPGGGGSPVPPFVPGLPSDGAGPGRPPGAGPRLPRTEVPTDVRPVVPGPPPRPGTDGSAGPLPGAGRYPGFPGTDRPGAVPAPGTGLPGEAPTRGGWAGAPGPGTGPPGPAEVSTGGRGAAEPGRLAAAERGPVGPGAGVLPLGGAPLGSATGNHRRPDYLVDDADAFADDRWFTPAVLTADGQDGWAPEGSVPAGWSA